MGSSRTLAAPALRTAAHAGWRSGVASALAVVTGRPSLWLLGALAFALRGGLLLLLVSILVLPTPIELRLLLGSNLGSAGFTPAFVGLLTFALLLIGLFVLAALSLIAYAETAAFERLLNDPETAEQLDGRAARQLSSAERRSLVAGLFTIQLVALAALTLAALPLLTGAVALAYQEIVRPSLGGTIYVRVLSGLREPLFVLLAGLVLVELVSSVASRRLLLRSFGLSGTPLPGGMLGGVRSVPAAVVHGILRPLARPLTTLATLVLAWAVSLAVLAPLTFGLGAAWNAVRAAYLSPGAAGDVQALVGLALVTFALAAIWTGAVLLGGFASALRAALWSLDGLR